MSVPWFRPIISRLVVAVLCSVSLVCGKDFECFQYSDHPTDKTLYRLMERGEWKNLTCRTGTLWDSQTCHCAADPEMEETHNPELIKTHCNNFREVPDELTKYEQIEPGSENWVLKDCKTFDPSLVWDQVVCQCVHSQGTDHVINVDPDSTACDTMFDSCFDTDTFLANGNAKWYIETTEETKVWIVDDVDAYNGLAVFIMEAPLIVPTFLNNELSESFQIYVRFRLEETKEDRLLNQYQVVFSNKCANQSASISLSYRPRGYSYRLVLMNATQTVPVVTECSYEAGDRLVSWKSVYILYQSGLIMVTVNGKPCMQFEFAGYPVFACPLAIGGYPRHSDQVKVDETNILGYVDVPTAQGDMQLILRTSRLLKTLLVVFHRHML